MRIQQIKQKSNLSAKDQLQRTIAQEDGHWPPMFFLVL